MISTDFEIVLETKLIWSFLEMCWSIITLKEFIFFDLLDRSIFHDKRNINFLMLGMKNHKFRFSQI